MKGRRLDQDVTQSQSRGKNNKQHGRAGGINCQVVVHFPSTKKHTYRKYFKRGDMLLCGLPCSLVPRFRSPRGTLGSGIRSQDQPRAPTMRPTTRNSISVARPENSLGAGPGWSRKDDPDRDRGTITSHATVGTPRRGPQAYMVACIFFPA